MKISIKLFYQFMAIFVNFSPTSSRLHPLQVENCDSNSRLVVDEDDNGKVRFERVKTDGSAVDKREVNLNILCLIQCVHSHSSITPYLTRTHQMSFQKIADMRSVIK